MLQDTAGERAVPVRGHIPAAPSQIGQLRRGGRERRRVVQRAERRFQRK